MDPLPRNMIEKLHAAKVATIEELHRVEVSVGADRQAIYRLAETVGSFATRADALYLMAVDLDAPDNTLIEVEELADFFERALSGLVGELKARRG